jgi:glutathione S-transferase
MWLVAELGLPYERVDVGGAFGGNDAPEFLAMNPNGLVPTIEDDGMTLWESHAIVRYLALKHAEGSICPADPRDRAMAERWMDWLMSTVNPNWGIMFGGLVRTAASRRNMDAINAAVARLGNSYQILERQLEGRDYIMGDQLTIADIPLGVSMYRYYALGVERPAMPNVDAWYARLGERGAYAEHVMVPFDSLRVTD